LSALQSDPSVPPQLAELASNIAQAMGALHGIERSGGAQIQPGAQTALTNVQTTLAQLQSQPAQYPAVAAAMEAVAGALASVHALARMAAPQAAPAAPPPQPAYAPPQQPAYAAPAQPPQPAPLAYAPTAIASGPQAYAPPPAAAAPAARVQAPAPAAPARPPVATGPGGQPVVIAAELGAHSPSNFYKGLSGNDVVDHGGLFVSTYKLPKLGEMVRLRVSMPGGYEFEANAIVKWRREPSDTPGDAPPGFGAQLAEITPDARQLVYRYVRNREPMFHDDL
jgi:hypothetical protein